MPGLARGTGERRPGPRGPGRASRRPLPPRGRHAQAQRPLRSRGDPGDRQLRLRTLRDPPGERQELRGEGPWQDGRGGEVPQEHCGRRPGRGAAADDAGEPPRERVPLPGHHGGPQPLVRRHGESRRAPALGAAGGAVPRDGGLPAARHAAGPTVSGPRPRPQGRLGTPGREALELPVPRPRPGRAAGASGLWLRLPRGARVGRGALRHPDVHGPRGPRLLGRRPEPRGHRPLVCRRHPLRAPDRRRAGPGGRG
mmetsp:Transcript_114344/g.356061  ORF Transcript_114344/g.356061 Transcript_114344/m.356061 type:complete len:254 (-) Transcript_114344:725-1486(-)